jgi:hypothetical protein
MQRLARFSGAGRGWTITVSVVALLCIAGTSANGLGWGLSKGLVAWLWDCLLPWVMIALLIGLPLLGMGALMGLGHRPRESPESSGTSVESTDGSHDQHVTRRFGGLGLTLLVFGAGFLALALFFASIRNSIADFIACVFGVSGGITLACGGLRSWVFYRRTRI